MKIQVGEILMNKTHKYMRSVMREYGSEFLQYYEGMKKLAIGIGDIIVMDSGLRFEKHLFFLIDTNEARPLFLRCLKWMQDHQSYEDDYPFDQITEGHMHMLVLRIPERFYTTFYYFKKGKYSKMYSPEDVERWFKDRPDVYSVLTRDHEYRVKFVEHLNAKYASQVEPHEFLGELEFPLDPHDEFFNFIHRITAEQYEHTDSEGDEPAEQEDVLDVSDTPDGGEPAGAV